MKNKKPLDWEKELPKYYPFIATGIKVVEEEYRQMPKLCKKCNGKMEFIQQGLINNEDKLGDIHLYKCKDCGELIEKFYPFPKEYADYWKGGDM